MLRPRSQDTIRPRCVTAYWTSFSRSLDNVTLPCGLQSLLVWCDFSRSLDNVTLPSAVQSLPVRYDFNQSLHNVTLPCGLQSLLVWYDFDRILDNVALNLVILDIGVRYGMGLFSNLTCDGSIGSGCFDIARHLHGPALGFLWHRGLASAWGE